MLRGVNAAQERLCGQFPRCSTHTMLKMHNPRGTFGTNKYRYLLEVSAAWQSFVSRGWAARSKEQLLVGAASDGETAIGKTRLVKEAWLARTAAGVT